MSNRYRLPAIDESSVKKIRLHFEDGTYIDAEQGNFIDKIRPKGVRHSKSNSIAN